MTVNYKVTLKTDVFWFLRFERFLNHDGEYCIHNYDTAKTKITHFYKKVFIFNKLHNQIFVIYNFKYMTEIF